MDPVQLKEEKTIDWYLQECIHMLANLKEELKSGVDIDTERTKDDIHSTLLAIGYLLKGVNPFLEFDLEGTLSLPGVGKADLETSLLLSPPQSSLPPTVTTTD